MSATVFRRESGQATVEFAFVVIILMSLIAGFVDLGRAVWHFNSLSQGVRAGARYAIVHGSTSGAAIGTASCGSTLEDRVKSRVAGLAPSQITVTCTWPSGNNDRGSEVAITGSATYVPILGAFWPGGASLTMSASSRMTITY